VIQAPKLEPRIMRCELTDYEWAAIKPMLPNKPRGVPRVNDRGAPRRITTKPQGPQAQLTFGPCMAFSLRHAGRGG
jgi:transposase